MTAFHWSPGSPRFTAVAAKAAKLTAMDSGCHPTHDVMMADTIFVSDVAGRAVATVPSKSSLTIFSVAL
jgi:hypothetical protein